MEASGLEAPVAKVVIQQDIATIMHTEAPAALADIMDQGLDRVLQWA